MWDKRASPFGLPTSTSSGIPGGDGIRGDATQEKIPISLAATLGRLCARDARRQRHAGPQYFGVLQALGCVYGPAASLQPSSKLHPRAL
eukprot:7380236-Prymnesium_polylepis.1